MLSGADKHSGAQGQILGEGVGARAVGTGLFALAGELTTPFICARSAHAHPGAGSCEFLRVSFGSFTYQDLLSTRVTR